MAGITHATPTAAADNPAHDVSADEWQEEHAVANGAFVAAKVAFTATDKVLGRSTAGAGNGEEITVTAAGRALIDDADAAAQRTTLGVAATSHVHSGADITSGTVVDARIDAAISRDSELTTHAGAADPHTGYQKESEKGAANGYASLGAGALVPVAQIASGTPDGTKFVRDDGTLAVPSTTGGTIVVREVDGTPTVASATTLVLPNGTLTNLGGGEVEYTPAGGGGGLSHSYIGYNTIGAVAAAHTGNRQYMRKVTLAAAGLIVSVGVYLRGNFVQVSSFSVGVLADAAGLPADVLAANDTGPILVVNDGSPPGIPGWVHGALGLYVAAGDYWLTFSGLNNLDIYHDTGGSDVEVNNTGSGQMIADGRFYTNIDSTFHYSVRASLLS